MASTDSRSEIVIALAEEFLDRYRRGERPALKEYIDRHPELEADIREAFPAMAMMENIALAEESVAAQSSRDRDRPEVLTELGDYRIIREVGRGGMGVVYEAEQVSLGRHVALKVLPRKMLLDPKQRRRFEREARSAAKLHHTNIVPVFGVGEQDGLPYYVMQFIQGLGLDEVLREIRRLRTGGAAVTEEPKSRGDLSAAAVARSLITGTFEAPPAPDSDVASPVGATRTHLPAASHHEAAGASAAAVHLAHQAHEAHPAPVALSGSLSGSSISLPGETDARGRTRTGRKPTYWQSIARIGLQVAEALDYAHRQGVQHRDIKPSNLLLDLRGTVWVTDFGLAKADDSENLTHTGDILGTLRYMPPEAFEGKGDARADVYALGLTLYELLALKPAYGEKDRHQLIKQVTTEDVPRLGRVARSVPRDLQTIVHKATERDPGHRYATAGQLADDLRRFVEDEPIHARTISVPERTWRWCRRNPAMAGLIAAVVLVTVGGFAANTYQMSVARAEARRADNNAAEAKANAVKAVASAAEARARADELEDANARLRLNQEQQRRTTYANQMNLIPPSATADNFPQVQNLLAKSRPLAGQGDLRGWEWAYWTRQVHPEATAYRLKYDSALAGSFPSLVIPDGIPPELLDSFMSSPFSGVGTWYVSQDGGRIARAGNGLVSLWDAKDGRQLLPKPMAQPANADSTGSKAGGKQSDAKAPAPPTGPSKAGTRGGQGKQSTAQDKVKDGSQGLSNFNATSRIGVLSRDGRRFAEVTSTLPPRGGGPVADPPPARSTLTVYDLDGAQEPYVETITPPTSVALNGRLAFDADGARLAVTSFSGSPAAPSSCALAIYDLNARQQVAQKSVEGFFLIDLVAFLPDTRQVLVSGSTTSILPNRGAGPAAQRSRTRTAIFDAQRAVVLSEVKIAANTLVAAVSPDGTRLAVRPQVELSERARGGFGGGPAYGPAPELKILDRVSGQELKTILVPAGIENVCFSADGKKLAGVTPLSWIIHVWDVESGNELYTFRGQATAVSRIAFTPDGTRLVSLDDPGTVKTWDLTAQPERAPMPAQFGSTFGTGPNGSSTNTSTGFDVTRDGRRSLETVTRMSRGGVIQGGRGTTVTSTVSVIVRDDQGRVLAKLEQATTGPGARGARGGRGTAFSPDGSKFAWHVPPAPPADGAPPPVGPQSRPATRWEVRTATGQKVCDLQWPNGRSPDATGQNGPFAAGGALGKFSPDGRSLAIVSGSPPNRVVTVFDTHMGQSLAEMPPSDFTPTIVAFTPDGEQLAIAGVNPNPPVVGSVISVVDVAEGTEWARFALPRRSLAGLTYSPDGRWLVGHSIDNAFVRGGAVVLPEIHVWDMNAEGREPLVLTGHTSLILDLAFTPDGNRLASLGRTQAGKSEIKIWDPATGQELLTLTEPADLSAIRFSADGHKLYVFDGQFRRAYDATPLPPATEALDVVDHLPPAETKVELDAQIARLKLSSQLRARVTEMARVTPPNPGGRGGFGGLGGGPGFTGSSPLSIMFRPGLTQEEYQNALRIAELNIPIQEQTALWLVRKGGALYRLGRYSEAIETLEKARDAWADAPTTKASPAAFLAMTYHRQGQAAKARSELDKMYKELKDNPPSWASPTNFYRLLFIEAETLVTGKSSGRIEAIPLTEPVGGGFEGGRDGSEITAENAMYFGSRSEAFYGLPLRLADQARSLSPGEGSAWLRYGGLLYRVGRFDDAIAALAKARDLGGLVPNAVAAPSAFLAMTYHRQGQAAKAKAELDRMYTELPNARFNSPTNVYRLFYIEAETLVAGKSSGVIESMRIYSRPQGAGNGPGGISAVTGAFRPGFTEAEYKTVWEAAQALKSSTPTGGPGWLRSGGALYRLDRYPEALVDLQKARELGGMPAQTGPAPTAFLAMTYHRLGQTDKAKQELDRLRREMKEEPFASARLVPYFVDFYAEAEAVVEGRPFDAERPPRDLTAGREIYLPDLSEADYRAALALADQLKTQAPANAVGWVRYGGALYRLGQYQAAIDPLIKAREIGGMPAAGRLTPTAFLAMTYHRLGQTEKAKQELARLRQEMQDERFISSFKPFGLDFMRDFYAEPAALIEGTKP
jgi:serine/threonine protein kinase/WD40 repeat protein/tetratricopeptide (TPR) repeat protein